MAGTYLLEMIILFLYKFKTASQWEQSFNSCRRQGGKRTFAVTFIFSPPAVSRSLTWYFSFHYRRYLKLLPCRAPQHCGVWRNHTNRGEVHNAILIPKLKHHFQSSPPAVSRGITGCFRQGIQGECPQGEGVETTEGLENTGNGSDRIKPYKSKILCPLFTPPHTANTAQGKRVKTRQ